MNISNLKLFTCLFVGSITLSAAGFSTPVRASNNCIDRFSKEILTVNNELFGKLQRQIEIDREIRNLAARRSALVSQIGAIMGADPSMKAIQGQMHMIKLYNEIAAIKKVRTSLEVEAFNTNNRIVELRAGISNALQNEMRKCLADEKPSRALVNFAVQGFALAATGNLNIPPPRRSSYVELSEILPVQR